MGIGKIGGGKATGGPIPTSAEVKAARLSEACAVEGYATNRIVRTHGKRAAQFMPLYLAKNGVWLGRARRRELACSVFGFKREYSVEEIAHITTLTLHEGGLLNRAWCGASVDPYPGPRMSRWGGVRSEATCPKCREIARGYTTGRSDV